MASFNKVFLIGNLTRDPEVRYTPKGQAVADLGLAVNRKWRDESGNSHEEVLFVDITVWGKTAEKCGQYLQKGSPLYIEGRLQLEQWDDKQTGQKRSKLKVVAEAVQFLGSRGDGAPAQQRTAVDSTREAQQRQRSAGYERGAQPGSDQAEGGLDGDDIPF
jgi:single-strand DNA-binding protein